MNALIVCLLFANTCSFPAAPVVLDPAAREFVIAGRRVPFITATLTTSSRVLTINNPMFRAGFE